MEKITDKLDARNLRNISFAKDSETGESFHDYKIDMSEEKDFGYLLFALNKYFEILEPPKNDNTLDHSVEFKEIRNNLYEYIISLENVKIENVANFQITEQGILKINFKDGKNEVINLIEKWNFFREEKIITNSKAEQEKLQEEISKEKFLGGAITYEYSKIIGGVAVGIPVGYNIYKVGEKIFNLKSITIETPNGTEKIEFEKPYYGTKIELESSIQKILEQNGLEYDPKTKKITSPIKNLLETTSKNLKNLTYEEAKKQNFIDEKISETDFEKLKQETIKKVDGHINLVKEGKISAKKGIDLIKKTLPNSLDIIFWPLFFAQAKKEETPMSLIKSVGGMISFNIGAKIGSKLAPGLWKIPASMLAGGAFIVGAEHFSEEVLEATRKKWQYFDKSNYSEGKSIAYHSLGLGIGEISDGIQSIYQKGREFVGLEKSEGMDIGIPTTNLNLPIFGHVLQIPEITFYQHKINLGTSPWDWLRDSAGRDITDWNEKVDGYKIHLTGEIYELLGDFYRNEGVFDSERRLNEAGSKEKLLEIELETIMRKDGISSTFNREINKIRDAILVESKNFSEKTIPNNVINEVISLYVDSMKIDKFFVEDRMNEQIIFEMQLITEIANLPISEEEKNLFKKFPERMAKNEEITQNDEEKKLYQKTLANNTKYHDMELGMYVAQLLDKMVELKEEKYFFKQIESGNKKGYEWKWTF